MATVIPAEGAILERVLQTAHGADVLAGAAQYDLAAVLDQRPVRVCGIGSIFTEPAYRDGDHVWELVERLLVEAARD